MLPQFARIAGKIGFSRKQVQPHLPEHLVIANLCSYLLHPLIVQSFRSFDAGPEYRADGLTQKEVYMEARYGGLPVDAVCEVVFAPERIYALGIHVTSYTANGALHRSVHHRLSAEEQQRFGVPTLAQLGQRLARGDLTL